MKTNIEKKNLLIEEYKTGEFNQGDLARRHGVATATVSNWLHKAGVATGKRGRKAYKSPTQLQQLMLLDAWTETYKVAAGRYGVSKQCLHHLAKRWKSWAEQEFGPRRLEPQLDNQSEPEVFAERTLSPNVISFRIPDSALAKIVLLRAHKAQFASESLHQVARDLLLTGLGQGYAMASSTVPISQTEAAYAKN